ncbi:MAG: hypothetical protein VYA84_13145 [Planctomycetota bacterium]|nr:hypothetical protein [Planctomycetota bacterium]
MKIQNQYPFSPANPVEDSLVEGENGCGDQVPLFKALVVGVACCWIGPAFLAFYYWYYGVIDDVAAVVRLLTVGYFGPALLFVGVGLLIGFGLSHACRSFDRRARRVVVASVAVVLFGGSIYLLLSNALNFDVGIDAFALPAFSVACGICVLVTTSTYLGLS